MQTKVMNNTSTIEVIEQQRQSERIKYGMREALKRTGYVGGKAPLGFHYNMEIEDYELEFEGAMLVTLIFKKLLERNSLKDIAKELNERGFNTAEEYRLAYKQGVEISKYPKTSQWTHAGVKRILTNSVYTGWIVYGKTKIDYATGERRKVETQEIMRVYSPSLRLISDEIFQKVQVMIAQGRSRCKVVHRDCT